MYNGVYVGSFTSALEHLIQGEAVKRPGWIGYWIIRDGKLEMHCKDGSVLVDQVNDMKLTLENVAACDWYAMSDGERKELDAIHEMVRKQKEKA